VAVRFECPCGKRLFAPDGSEGRRARCPVCRSVFRIGGRKRRRKRTRRGPDEPDVAATVEGELDREPAVDRSEDDDEDETDGDMGDESSSLEFRPRDASSKGRILLADDDADIVGAIQRALRDQGYEVAVAYDGQEAIQLAEESPPDLAIIEVTLTKVNGFHVCNALKGQSADLPVLMMTARRKRGDTNYSLSAKADGFMRKPFAPRDLISRVGELLSSRN